MSLPDFPSSTRFYQARMRKNGPFVGVAVWEGAPWVDGEELDRAPRLQALVRTETTARAVILMGVDTPVEIDGIWLQNVTHTTRANYEFLVEHARYSTAHAPDNPDAMPTKAIDFNKMEPIF